VPEERGDPPAHLVDFVRSLGHAESALDLGCGDGRLTVLLDAVRVVGADVSDVALARARRRGLEVVPLVPGRALSFEDGSFDLVVSTEVVEHVHDVQRFLSEVRRVLRPRGRLALTTPAHWPLVRTPDPLSPHVRLFTRRSLHRLLDEMGFEVVDLRRRAGTLMAVAAR
jgi:SAM-dependent methyltransferase